MNHATTNPLRRRRWLQWGIIFGVGLLAGVLFFGGADQSAPKNTATTEADAETIWTCSMHPQIRLHEPGKCPICFMDLIPLKSGGDETVGNNQLVMSESAVRLAEIVTVPVTRGQATSEVRTVGKVVVDERRLRRMTAWVGGRLDRLFVDYTGATVAKGDHLVEIYSPELYSAQVELIQSLKARDELQASDVELLRSSAETTIEASREKLRLLGLKPEQIRKIEDRGKVDEHVTLSAPIAGVVIHKAAVEGEYVKTGAPIYTIAELSQVWVMLDVYESDLAWVHLGQEVSFEVEAFPGEAFLGKVAFIDPTVNSKTRTVNVRLNVENSDLRLKPDMFVRAVIRSRVRGDGRSFGSDFAGKWVCPMHLEVIKDGPGICDICEMPLVRAEKLGLVQEPSNQEPPLLIPVTAPLITGKRAIVYLRIPGTEKPTFEGREVVLGPRAGDSYIVRGGLNEGDLVVVNGSFKIDSAMQIQAKPSMMSPEGGAPPPTHHHEGSMSGDSTQPPSESAAPDGSSSHEIPEGFRQSLDPLFATYFEMQAALAQDNAEAAGEAAGRMEHALHGADSSDLSGDLRRTWDGFANILHDHLSQATGAAGLEQFRDSFESLSGVMIELDRSVGPPQGQTHHLLYCSMAFNKRGAYWLQTESAVHNPFFGKAMQRCGEHRETFGPAQEEPRQ